MLLDINAIPEDASLRDVIETFIEQGHEGAFWDFKKIWPSSNIDLVHDIVCMANNLESSTSYIIIGIDEENGYTTFDVRENFDHRKNTQQLCNLLWKYPWAYAMPSVEVEEIDFDDGYIDVIVVQRKTEAAPYFFTKEIERKGKKLHAGAIYTRIKDSNTPVDETASPHDAEMLWKMKFGLDLTPLEKFLILLSQHEMWQETLPHPDYDQEAFSETFYHKQFPEYTFMKIPDDSRNAWEYFMFVCPFNDGPNWYRTRFYFHNTLLREDLGAYVDHHFFPLPLLARIPAIEEGLGHEKLFYRYYIVGSLNDQLEQFCLLRESDGSVNHDLVMKVVPRYNSESERGEFEAFLSRRPELLIAEKTKARIHMFEPSEKPQRYRDDYLEYFREEAEYGAALVRLLEQYRLDVCQSLSFL